MTIDTPYYLIDEDRMRPIMERIRYVEQSSGAKSVLALKCFSSWCAFPFMRQYMAGTTSSSLYEAQLGHEKFGGENHGYSVAYTEVEIKAVAKICNKVIFNSVDQLQRFKQHCKDTSIGLRINPEIGFSSNILSDTFSQYSRLGVIHHGLDDDALQIIDGVMFHMNCDNYDFDNFSTQLSVIEKRFEKILKPLDWVSLGGGVAFTEKDYPLERFCQRLTDFSNKFDVQVYLEPGEAAVTESTSLIVSILDITNNGLPTMIVDAGVETHLLDVLTYQYSPTLLGATIIDDSNVDECVTAGKNVYRICGRTCLSGDVFGHYIFDTPPTIGDTLTFDDVGGYSMVKKNFFNGIRMPSIRYKNSNGQTQHVREFDYNDFKRALS